MADHKSLYETYGQEFKSHLAVIISRPSSRNSVTGAPESITSVHLSATLHPTLQPVYTPSHFDVAELGQVVCTPISHDFYADIPDTPLPTYRPLKPQDKSMPFYLGFRSCTWASIKKDIILTTLRRCYHIIFIGFTVFYRNRVHRIFKEVRRSADDLMEKMIQHLVDQARREGQVLSTAAFFFPADDLELNHLQILWESFVELSIREWKTTNLEGKRTGDRIFWNTRVLLAMPVAWLSWSLVLYIVGIMAFVWRAGSSDPSPRVEIGLASRIAITCLLCVGVVYFVLIMLTLNNYGDRMDDAWREKVCAFAAERNIKIQRSFEGTIRIESPTGRIS
ncbi:hypothetical protein DXG01_016810 [Tephrocybe rancida]|nr:hypothetical protein DXG01_016810 [Tephrocybe rancida]